MMNTDTYKYGYSDDRYKSADTYNDLLPALEGDLQATRDQYKVMPFHTVMRPFDLKDSDWLVKHETATFLEVGLDAAVSQFLSRVLNPIDRSNLLAKYEQKQPGKQLPDTSLNRLDLKLKGCDRMIAEFKSIFPVTRKRHYRFRNYRLTDGEKVSIKFLPGRASPIILGILFKNKMKRAKTKTIVFQVQDKLGLSRAVAYDKVERACEYMNRRLSKETGEPDWLVSFTEKYILLNEELFDD